MSESPFASQPQPQDPAPQPRAHREMADRTGGSDDPLLAPGALDRLVDQLLDSYDAHPQTEHLNALFLPSRARAVEIVELLRRALFPGFFDEQRLASRTVRYHAGELLSRLRELVYDQVRQALRNHRNREGLGLGDACTECDDEAHLITMRFLARLPEVRRLLASDVQAGYDGDPAAESTDEVIFCYPGLDATFIQRVAHELYRLKVPLLPRIMTEYAHNETGIDIHPGAVLGESFFIDHGTGVVIGETTVIGARVKVYQGVTLGALSTKGGQRLRGVKRHPTIEDDVTLYGGAVILGGQTVIGRGSTIGGAVFLTKSVPPNHTVVIKDGEVRMVGPQL